MTEPSQVQVHPLAALSEATFDVEVARNRRLMLANDVYVLRQMVTQKDERIKELEAALESHRLREGDADLAGNDPVEEDTEMPDGPIVADLVHVGPEMPEDWRTYPIEDEGGQ